MSRPLNESTVDSHHELPLKQQIGDVKSPLIGECGRACWPRAHFAAAPISGLDQDGALSIGEAPHAAVSLSFAG